ncbi:MAG: MT-A70 family methyltransferase [Steroidobacteraceae bacterium]
MADPPWQFGDRLPGRSRGADKHYPTMPLAEIISFPLPPLADDVYLFLWRVAAMQAEALAVAVSWGFTIKTELVWYKQTTGGKPHFGMGHHLRAAHETCLIGVRGKPKPLVRNIRSVFTAPVGRHSAKPDAFYQLVERFAAGPYVELFCRTPRDGWDSHGLELDEAHPLSEETA